MSGGKGSSQTTSVAIPEYIEASAQRNLNKAEAISQLGYVPYYGPDVAAFSPAQQAAFQNTAGAAGAFGLASPTDPYGGMGAPTDFGGVQGYSSAPLYQQSVDALAANRPGQKQYIDSFFIDPTTGAAGANVQPAINYADFSTMADMQRFAAEEQARQAERAANVTLADVGYGGPYSSMNGLSGMTMGDDGVYRRDGTTAVQTSLRPQMRPDTSANADGGTGGASGGGYTGFSDMFDGGGPGKSGGAFSGGGALSSVANAATGGDGPGGDGPGGDKVICTALHEMGRLSDDVYALDAQFGLRVNSQDPMLGDGYRVWATSVANYIKGDSIGSKVALAIVSPVAKAWAAEMAHVMRPDEYKPNVIGKALMAVGHPICRTVGKVLLPKMKKEAV